MKARISNLSKTEAEWNKLNFVPFDGELIVYIADENYRYPRLKIGDGSTPLQLLPFFSDAQIEAKLLEHTHTEVNDAGRISIYFPK